MWCGQLPDAPAATRAVGGLHRTSGARQLREPDHPSCRRTQLRAPRQGWTPARHGPCPPVQPTPRGDAAGVTQAPLRCFILWWPSPASRSSSSRRSGRSTLTPARSATPSRQRRTTSPVDQQPRSQIRSLNALAESFLASRKGECLDQHPWPTRTAARHATVEYIAWYNGTRLHGALGYMTPDESETATDEEPSSRSPDRATSPVRQAGQPQSVRG
jgi:hypothetical protein